MSKQQSISDPPIILGGSEVKKLTFKKKTHIVEQVVDLLQPHVKACHMVQQSITGLIKHIDNNLAVVALTHNDEVLGFAKLYPYRLSNYDESPQGYEFSSWIVHPAVAGNGIGGKILMKSVETYHKLNNPQAGFFAICVVENIVPQQKLLAAGGVLMERPIYAPNMLEAQTGQAHEEVIINLKTILKKYEKQ